MKKTFQYLALMILSLNLIGCSSPESRTNELSLPQTSPGEAITADEIPSYSGDFLVKGYARAATIHESFCEDRDCPTYEYVTFNITTSSDPILPTSIGLGCREGSTISYSNDSDEFGIQEKQLSESLTTSILTSSKSNPILLKVIKLPISNNRLAPTCSSEFTTIEAASN